MAVAVRDLAAERPIIEALIGRTLRRAEQAIDVLRLDQALEAAKDELEQAIRDEMLLATAAWLRGSAVRPAMHVTEKMVAILDELRQIGREEAELELERLGYDVRRRALVDAEAPEGRDVDGYIRRELGGITARIEDELVGVDLGGASHSAIAQALLRVPGARDLASRVISTALIDGMGQTWEENRDLVGGWQYTAILDGGTCESCAPLDGTTYATIEELFVVLPDFGPNPECFGGGRCRCRAVPIPAHESPSAVTPPPEPEPPLRGEALRQSLAQETGVLSFDAGESLAWYTAEGYDSINQHLRRTAGPSRRADVLGLDEAFASVEPLSQAAIVYRKVNIDFAGADVSAGDFLRDPAFVSTSVSREYVVATSTSSTDIIEIVLPEGIRVLDVNALIDAPYPSEREILLPRGLTFVVESVRSRGAGSSGRIIRVRVVSE